MDIDDTDRAILRELQGNARTPFSEIARRIDMSSATVHDRVKQLEDKGVIKGYHASIDPAALGFDVEAYVGLRVEQGATDAVLDALEDVEAVQEVALVTGEWDAIMTVVAGSTDELRELLFEEIAIIEGFDRSQTMVVLGHGIGDREIPV